MRVVTSLVSLPRNSLRSLCTYSFGVRSTQFRTATTHFGNEQVDEVEKEKRVHHVFANVANKYDMMNDAMSLGIHRLWKDYYVGGLPLGPNSKVIDVAGGTGDIAFRLQRRIAAGGKVDKSKLEWVCANAEQLPFDENSFDAYTISFGIRNCTHVDQVVREAFRVLKPGGVLAVLEFSAVKPLFRPLYDAYSFNVIPVMGQVLAGDYDSYKYLVESIRKFPNQEDFAAMIRSVGFDMVRYENLSFGICAIHKGTKPYRAKQH
ncbi:ubiquinone/menaquinone biosynthesis methyltransferase [Necator americanus]|uniref:2-methoxy-6-polyprenyl-1,4-benzoquinol methylase, mitochondrial n=1 Tax=Necator americanus TaxID=51031 RepID=W2SGT1_NECAM|nr:ubiquinone/menaquinone biosynthesis methyltransferase [Necator americanus]ETN68790.1 ubiquinone/menaquinone biosynthesis methyltransferase [Necator americanus]